MFARLFSFLMYIIVAYIVFALIRTIFNMGKTAGEFNRRVDEMNRTKRENNSRRGKDVIELDRDQYKVE